MRKLIYSCLLLTIVWGARGQASETLSLEQAIVLAIENNHNLKIQQKRVAIAENNVFQGNAGLVPTISLLGNASYQNTDTDAVIRTFQESPPTFPASDGSAVVNTYSALVQVDYVLLGGFSGKYEYQFLKDTRDAAYLEQKAMIDKTVMAVVDLFMEIAKLQSREELLRRNVTIGAERLTKIQDQFEFGKVSGLTVLRTKTDLNQDQTLLDNILVARNNLKRDLNFLIGLPAELRYRVSVSYNPPEIAELDDLKLEVLSNNPEILLGSKGVTLAEKQLRMNTAGRLPVINAYANYGYFRQEADLQPLAEIQNLGYTVGVGLRYNLFSGGKTNRSIQEARLNQEISRFEEVQIKDRIIADAVKERNNLIMLWDHLGRELENIETFRESYRRTEERFKNGKVSSLDLRDAQNSLLLAEITISNLKADILKSSLQLESLKGSLIQGIEIE